MSADYLWLDGNALAGLLQAVFDTDMTSAQRRCQSCGTRSALGAHRAYRGAGAVLRCPACGHVAMRIATLPDRHVVTWIGEITLVAPMR
ncbi:MAG: DUF6510 family protein [Solirubrobacteraceae bacterium]